MSVKKDEEQYERVTPSPSKDLKTNKNKVKIKRKQG